MRCFSFGTPQVLGFDFMMDQDFHLTLIEVNGDPWVKEVYVCLCESIFYAFFLVDVVMHLFWGVIWKWI